jgi:glucosamine--fructose-6-phosphate aminotransferase (isomerizing)
LASALAEELKTLHAKLLSNIREIQARGAITIVIAEESDETVAPDADHLIEMVVSGIRCK